MLSYLDYTEGRDRSRLPRLLTGTTPPQTFDCLALGRLLLPRAWSLALSYVTTQVNCSMRNNLLMCDASCQDHHDLVSLLYTYMNNMR